MVIETPACVFQLASEHGSFNIMATGDSGELRAKLLGLFKEYGVTTFEGRYTKL